jgi:hypothetical protein
MKRIYLLTLILGLLATTIVAPKLFHSAPKAPEQASTIQASTIQASTIQASTIQASTIQASTIPTSAKLSKESLSFEPISTLQVFGWVSGETYNCQGKAGDKFHPGSLTCTDGKLEALPLDCKVLGSLIHCKLQSPLSNNHR